MDDMLASLTVDKEEKHVFGIHWCGPDRYPLAEETLIAEYPGSDDEHQSVKVYCIASPARFYLLDVTAGREGQPACRISTGSDQAALAAMVASNIAAGMLAFRLPKNGDIAAATRATIEAQVLSDFAYVKGRQVRAWEVTGYQNDASVTVTMDPPLLCRIIETSRESLCNWNGGWCDPSWNLEPLEERPETAGLTSLFMFGKSYSLKNGRSDSMTGEFVDVLSCGDLPLGFSIRKGQSLGL